MITRDGDGRIVLVRNFRASSDVEAISIVTAKGRNIRMDLWSDWGLVRCFADDPD